MRMIATLAAAFIAAATLSTANAEQASVAEVEAGCPVQLPVLQVANTNFVVLDRTSLTRECLQKIYEQNGDGVDSDDDGDDE